MRFDRLQTDAEFRSDLRLSHAVTPTQNEDFTAARRQRCDRGIDRQVQFRLRQRGVCI